MKRLLLTTVALISSVLLAACQTLAVPTVTPTRSLTAPTLAPTAPAFPLPPSEVPGSFIDPFGASDPTAAALPNDLDLPPLVIGSDGGVQTVQITTSADTVILGDLYATVPVRAPGVLLVGEDKAAWGTFPRTLEQNGYPTLVVALPPNIPIGEFQEVLGSFIDLGQGDAAPLDPGRIAVIGEGTGAVTALRGCTADARCDIVGLLSPTSADGLLAQAGIYGPRPMLVSASRMDTAVFQLSEGIAAAGTGDVTFQPFDDAGQGAAMLTNRPDFPDFVLVWLNRHLRG
jgi:hypothetical protein